MSTRASESACSAGVYTAQRGWIGLSTVEFSLIASGSFPLLPAWLSKAGWVTHPPLGTVNHLQPRKASYSTHRRWTGVCKGRPFARWTVPREFTHPKSTFWHTTCEYRMWRRRQFPCTLTHWSKSRFCRVPGGFSVLKHDSVFLWCWLTEKKKITIVESSIVVIETLAQQNGATHYDVAGDNRHKTFVSVPHAETLAETHFACPLFVEALRNTNTKQWPSIPHSPQFFSFTETKDGYTLIVEDELYPGLPLLCFRASNSWILCSVIEYVYLRNWYSSRTGFHPVEPDQFLFHRLEKMNFRAFVKFLFRIHKKNYEGSQNQLFQGWTHIKLLCTVVYNEVLTRCSPRACMPA